MSEGSEAPLTDLLDATQRLVLRQGIPGLTLEAVAEEAGLDVELVRQRAESPNQLLLELMCRVMVGPIDGIVARVNQAPDGEAALGEFIRGLTDHYLANLDDVRIQLMFALRHNLPLTKLDTVFANERIYPHMGRLYGSAEKRLAETWGDELPHGIHSRRLVFISHLAVSGLLHTQCALDVFDARMAHTESDVIDELVHALVSPTAMMLQLGALADAARELAEIREETQLLERAPQLLCETFALDTSALALSSDRGLEIVSVFGDGPPATPPEVYRRSLRDERSVYTDGDSDAPASLVTPVSVGGSVVGVLAAYRRSMDRRDASRVETFAALLGSTLDNVRFYQTLNDRVDERTRQLRETQAALVQSEKMAALGRLVAGVAHEVNTPLGAIASGHESMARALALIEEALAEDAPEVLANSRKLNKGLRVMRSCGGLVEQGTERVAAMVDRLKRFARLDEADLQLAELHDCIDDAIALLAPELGEGVRIERDYGDVGAIRCAARELNQVFFNLLLNAHQAIGEEGSITVRTTRVDDEVRVTISDTGEGIPEEHLSKVFDPGFTTRGVGVGAGLGLSICHQIVNQHGGRIEITSESGSGTTVRVALPA